jgi:hypothetical protein
MKKEFESVSDIATYYEELYRSVEYPKFTPKPNRKDFSNNASYGVALDEHEAKELSDKKLRQAYNEKTGEITAEFKKALLKFLSVDKHPKKDELWRLAWEHGHSSGYHDVALYADEFSELML